MNASKSPWVADTQPQTGSSIYRPTRATHADQKLSLDHAEKGVMLHVGDKFSLDLDSELWNVRLKDETVLAMNGTGTFEALKGGKTKVYATSATPKPQAGAPGKRARVFLEIPVTVYCG